MVKEQVIGSYIIRFTKSNRRTESSLNITLQNIKTGEQLKFETWLAAWAFLESVLENEEDISANTNLSEDSKTKFVAKVLNDKVSRSVLLSTKDIQNVGRYLGGLKEKISTAQ